MEFKEQLQRHIQRLNQVVDLEAVAQQAGLKRPGGKGNWGSPHHDDKSPSLSIYQKNGEWRFKDFSNDEREASGDAIALLQYIGECNAVVDAVKWLGDMYNLPFEPEREKTAAPRERSQAEWLTDECLKNPEPSVAYLVGRGIPEATVRTAVQRKAVGYSDWRSTTTLAGQVGHQGPAVAFICRDLLNGLPMAVDKRFIDADVNGGVKTQTNGEKSGFPWVMDRGALSAAHTVYIVESAINALCIEACGFHRAAALALRGTGNVANIDWRLLMGKRVVLALDADLPDAKGKRPGSAATWAAYEALIALNIAAQIVDTGSWYDDDCNDVADIARKFGIAELKERLEKVEVWAIAGLPGKETPGGKWIGGKPRVFLPAHDFSVYWRYQTKPDFTSYVSKVEDNPDGGTAMVKLDDVAGFRVASLSRVSIASATSTMSGESDAMPTTVFAVSVQTARHGPVLLRRVMEDERLHNVDQWKKLGPIFHQQRFSRLLNILERSAGCGARDAVNFVGLAWRDGKPIVNEGPDCYFTEPEKQCPYHNLTFPSGRRQDATTVIEAYQSTYGRNAMSQALVWALGGHLKAFLGFWPHMVMQSRKGSGKSTQIKRLERTIGMTMFSGQSLQTEFRLITSTSCTSHPVGWEELSARRQDIIDRAVGILQESYQHTVTRRGSEMTEFLLCAPVLLAGEDVPVRNLTGKLVRCSLDARLKGAMMSESLPRFPLREWLQFLATLKRDRVMELLGKSEAWLHQACRAAPDDHGAQRMVRNYAAVLTSWTLLCEFTGLARATGDFATDLRREMNEHIKETAPDREPYVWILELVAGEIESNEYRYPWKIDDVQAEGGTRVPSLILRPAHVMDHISKSPRLREQWNGLSVKTGRVFAQQLEDSGLVVKTGLDLVINGRRNVSLTALSLDKLAELGVHLSMPEEEARRLDQLQPYLAAANG